MGKGFSLKEVTREQVREKIRKLKGGGTHGGDFITSEALKISGYFIEEPLMMIINKSIKEGIYPTVWKTQITHPTHKKGRGDRLEDWRPVKHIEELGKLCESLIGDQIILHFMSKNLFHPSLHGGLPGLSTLTACAEIQDLLLMSNDRGLLGGLLLVDQQSAYDVISHRNLLEKMRVYKFCETTINWFRTYLGERSNQVVIQASSSKIQPAGDRGTPQGSVLGCILYNVYSNDLPMGREGDTTDFVDDHTDQCEGDTVDTLCTKLQVEADLTANWLRVNGMAISGDKSKVLVMKTDTTPDITITLDGTQLRPTKSERYLGIYMSSDLSWQEHLYGETWRSQDNYPGLVATLNSRIGMLSKLKKYTSKEKMMQMVDGIVLSKLRYNLGVVGNIWLDNKYQDTQPKFRRYTKKDNHNLQVCMNKALRMAMGIKDNNYPTTRLLKEANKMSVHQEIAYQIGCCTKKILDTGRPKSLGMYLREVGTRTTRRKRYERRDTRYQITKESLVNHGINLLDKIPPEILAIEKMDRFKEEYKKWVKNEISIKP